MAVVFTGIFTTQVKAQVSNYSFSVSTGTFTEITTAGGATQPALTGGSNDDGYFNSIPIGFSLAYDGNIYNSLSASTNGFVVLGTDLTYGNTYNDLTTTTPRPILTPLWDDLDLSSGSFLYQTEGITPNRIFTAQWLSMEWYYSANVPVISFQLKLYETTNTIDFIYRQEANQPSSGCSASIGITSVGTGSGNFLSLDNTSAAPTASSLTETTTISTRPATGQVYTFGPPIATQPPNCVNIAYPGDGDTNVLIYPEFMWASGGGVPEGYLLFIGDDGGGVSTPTNIVNGDTVVPPYMLSNPLNYLITYYWQVIPFNSFGQATGCPIYSFTTQPDPTISTFPFFESFENSVPPFTWLETIVNPGSGTLPDWTMESTGYSPNCMPHDGLQMAKFNSYSCSSGSSRLSTPPLNMAALTSPGLSFWMYHDDGYNTYYNEGIQVQVSTDGLVWNDLDSLILRLSPTNHWEQHIFDLSIYAGQTIYLGFLGVSQYGNNIFMDEVSVNEASGPPPCANMNYPANGDTGVAATPSLIFNQGGLPSAAGFRLYFGTDGGGIVPPTDIENGTILTSPYVPATPLTY
ncbi:MAG: choice-of-anchor J domain-containing protein, partial [Candidatus Methanomethylophilaceae archaeon]|nr:choice-of-anchor J domain-containing protein [Candidatus Methanomethylophilaceae archaeon]